MSIDHNNQINFMPPAGVSRLGRCSDSGAAAPLLESRTMAKKTLKELGKRIAYQYVYKHNSVDGFPVGLTSYYFNDKDDADLFLSYIPRDKRGKWTQHAIMPTPTQFRVDVLP